MSLKTKDSIAGTFQYLSNYSKQFSLTRHFYRLKGKYTSVCPPQLAALNGVHPSESA